MAHDPDVLRGLLEREKAAFGPDSNIDFALYEMELAKDRRLIKRAGEPFLTTDREYTPCYSGSIDQALGLVCRMLPGYGYRIQRSAPGMKPVATLFAPIELPDAPIDDGRSWAVPTDGTGATDALAILAALLTAALNQHSLTKNLTSPHSSQSEV